jgi:hypothetical protein
MNATESGEACWNAEYPASDATAETSAMSAHIPRIRSGLHPPALNPTVDEIASGTFEMRTAAR